MEVLDDRDVLDLLLLLLVSSVAVEEDGVDEEEERFRCPPPEQLTMFMKDVCAEREYAYTLYSKNILIYCCFPLTCICSSFSNSGLSACLESRCLLSVPGR